ncbi:MAG: hypothetical protein KAX37_00805 [Opitutaceae bacterium]|nr:hypothetical protein [Opitutaceae bacterium]
MSSPIHPDAAIASNRAVLGWSGLETAIPFSDERSGYFRNGAPRDARLMDLRLIPS